MGSAYDDDTRVTEQAARWLGSLLESNDNREAFFAWLAESPRHVEEFLFLLGDAGDLAGLGAGERAAIEKLALQMGPSSAALPTNVVPVSQRALASYDDEANARTEGETLADTDARAETHARTTARAPTVAEAPVAATTSSLPSPARRRVPRYSLAIAASLLVAAVAFFWIAGVARWTSYETTIGEQRTLELADGSIVHLNTDSKIAVNFNSSSRQVQLIRGEALFSVQHDAARTFTVHAAHAVIQAIGTEFDVYRRDGDTRVAVIDGLVQLSSGDAPAKFPIERVSWTGAFKKTPAADKKASAGGGDVKQAASSGTQLLKAGQAATISLEGQVASAGGADVAKAIAWRQRRLVFENDSLEHIAAEFNRYNSRLKIRVEGAAGEQQHFSGTFDADAPEALIQALEAGEILSIKRNGGEIVIRNREDPHAE